MNMSMPAVITVLVASALIFASWGLNPTEAKSDIAPDAAPEAAPTAQGSATPKRKQVIGNSPAASQARAREAMKIYHEEKAVRLAANNIPEVAHLHTEADTALVAAEATPTAMLEEKADMALVAAEAMPTAMLEEKADMALVAAEATPTAMLEEKDTDKVSVDERTSGEASNHVDLEKEQMQAELQHLRQKVKSLEEEKEAMNSPWAMMNAPGGAGSVYDQYMASVRQVHPPPQAQQSPQPHPQPSPAPEAQAPEEAMNTLKYAVYMWGRSLSQANKEKILNSCGNGNVVTSAEPVACNEQSGECARVCCNPASMGAPNGGLTYVGPEWYQTFRAMGITKAATKAGEMGIGAFCVTAYLERPPSATTAQSDAVEK